MVSNAVRCVPPQNKPTPGRDRDLPRASSTARLAALPRLRAVALPRPDRARDAAARARRAARRASLRPRRAARPRRPRGLRQLSLLALQHQHRPADARDVRGGLRRPARPSRRGARTERAPDRPSANFLEFPRNSAVLRGFQPILRAVRVYDGASCRSAPRIRDPRARDQRHGHRAPQLRRPRQPPSPRLRIGALAAAVVRRIDGLGRPATRERCRLVELSDADAARHRRVARRHGGRRRAAFPERRRPSAHRPGTIARSTRGRRTRPGRGTGRSSRGRTCRRSAAHEVGDQAAPPRRVGHRRAERGEVLGRCVWSGSMMHSVVSRQSLHPGSRISTMRLTDGCGSGAEQRRAAHQAAEHAHRRGRREQREHERGPPVRVRAG